MQQAASRAKRRIRVKQEADFSPAEFAGDPRKLLDETPTSHIFSEDPATRALVQRVARQYGMMAQAMAREAASARMA